MASPEPGYVRPTQPLGGSSRGAIAVIVTVVVALAVVLLKPWDVVPTQSTTARAAASAEADLARAPEASPTPPAPTQPAPTPPWPASAAAIPSGTIEAASGEALDDLRHRAGTWGIWIAGAGPRLSRDRAWTDWMEVPPETSTGAPSHMATWPGTDVCGDLPALPDRPSVVGVTTPAIVGAGPRVVGWWTDGVHVASLTGSIGYLSTATPANPGGSGAPLLVRVDGATWPAGRYELHVVFGEATTGLTFCLGLPD
jgi:hypothetical protein